MDGGARLARHRGRGLPALALFLLSLFPWEPGWKWPWESAGDAAAAFNDMVVRCTVGGLCMVLGIALIWLGIKGGTGLLLPLLGLAFFAGGLLFVIGVIG